MLSASPARAVGAPALPPGRGPLSAAVRAILLDENRRPAPAEVAEWATGADPFGEDLQLALYCCYELHYRGFSGIPEEREWNLELLSVRRELERSFLMALRAQVEPGSDVDAEVAGLLVEPLDATGVSHHLRWHGELWQLREYVAHRSLYHLKEADPQAWVVPRLVGPAKAALVSVQHDEYGGGDPDRLHARLFAEMMSELGLCSDYGHYLPQVPAPTLAEVNFMSLCGLHRALRGALVGQFAMVELTSSPGSDRLVRAIRRLGCGEDAARFYDEHVEADAVHEQVIRHGVLGPMLATEPELAGDVVFGIRAGLLLADRHSEHLLTRWAQGGSSLRRPLPAEHPNGHSSGPSR